MSADEHSATVERTDLAPSLPVSLLPRPDVIPPPRSASLAPGERIDDFEIVDVLGQGAFGVVYLARQLSLDRSVALKVTAFQSSEGRSLARLDHEHIVQVFSENVDSSGSWHLLCMRYVAGPTLEAVSRELRKHDPQTWNGALLLEIVDGLTRHPAVFDPAGLRNREILQRADWIETVCWIGGWLAETLAYAHQQGVLHRDVKPSNILITQYGYPTLLDFNLAFRPLAAPGPLVELFGGTLAYMSPEHLDAFNPAEPAGPEVVSAGSDIYSLGVVLYELLTGERPFPKTALPSSSHEALRYLASARRAAIPVLSPQYARPLRETLCRCLHPDRRQRYASARELSAALEGCREFHRVEKGLPATGHLRRAVARHPFGWLLAIGLVPHIMAGFATGIYHHIRVANHLNDFQQTTFARLAFVYAAVVCPLALGLVLWVIAPVRRAWEQRRSDPPGNPLAVDAARTRSLSWPVVAAGLACLVWLPAAVVLAIGLELLSGPVPWPAAMHLVLACAVAALIATAYSSLFAQYLQICVFYPQLWLEARGFRQTAAAELLPIRRRLRLFQVLTGLVPLAIVALMLALSAFEGGDGGTTNNNNNDGVAANNNNNNNAAGVLAVNNNNNNAAALEHRSFHFFLSSLAALGLLGYHLTLFWTAILSRAVSVLAGQG